MNLPLHSPARRSPTFGIQKRELLVVICIALALAALVVPLPRICIDLLLSGQLIFAVCLLISVLMCRRPDDLTLFPSILVLATLARLTLNVSTTRAILSDADAGAVVRAFGEGVAAGNPLIGGILFLLITLVQFVVVSQGAERIAQVAARFTLDALPGRQQAIEAEQRLGHLSPEEAQKQRECLDREATLFSSLDGAMRFIRGDAVVGLCIVPVNAVGGLIIAMGQSGLSFEQALSTYTILTVGDGLSSQMPSLIQGIAAATLATRLTSENSAFTHHLIRQLTSDGRPWIVGYCLCILCALFSPLPSFPFFAVALACALITRWAQRQTAEEQKQEPLISLTKLQPYLRFHPTTLRALCPQTPENLLERIQTRILERYGIQLPPFVLDLNSLQLPKWGYRIEFTSSIFGEGILNPELCFKPLESESEPEAFRDPYMGTWGVWQSESCGQTSIKTFRKHFYALMRLHPECALPLQEITDRLQAIEADDPALAHQALSRPGGINAIAQLLRRMVSEGLSIRDLPVILEQWVAISEHETDFEALYAELRVRLRPLVLAPFQFAKAVEIYEPSKALLDCLEPDQAATIPPHLTDVIDVLWSQNPHALFCVPQSMRANLRRNLEQSYPGIGIICPEELNPQKPVRVLGLVWPELQEEDIDWDSEDEDPGL